MVLCKDQKGKCGLSLFSVNKGVFVCFVGKGSPASMAGVRFGDQVLMVSCTHTQKLFLKNKHKCLSKVTNLSAYFNKINGV